LNGTPCCATPATLGIEGIADFVGHTSTSMIDPVYTYLRSSFYTDEMKKFDISPKKN